MQKIKISILALLLALTLGLGTNSVEATGKKNTPPPPPEETTATLVATKIVCPTEDLLPNLGNHGPNITGDTASDFIAENPECEIVPWTFEWAPEGTPNPGDHVGAAGGDWTAFPGSTNTEIPAGSKIWVREQFVEGYIPFTGVNTDQNVSAEFYCHTDVLHYDNYDFIHPVVAEETYFCVGFNALVEEEQNEPEEEVENSCPLPDTLGDETSESVENAPEGEDDLQEILDDASYGLDVQADQKQFQVWNVPANSEVIIDAKFVAKFAGHVSVFGYYTDGELANFVPVFKTGTVAGYEAVPMYTDGPFSVNTGLASTLGFAIKTFSGSTPAGDFATENSLNEEDQDQVVVYNPASNTYVLAFEDVIGGDYDYNDLVVEVTLACEELEEEENLPPVADAGPDQAVTLPNDQISLDGSGSSDPDGTIVSYVWSFVSGPSNVDPEDVVSPDVSGLLEGTYVFKLVVTDDDGAEDEDTVSVTVHPADSDLPECSDGLDNDEDELIDSDDPGCHTDGDPDNSESYDPEDNDETDEPDQSTPPQCSDGLDNDRDGKIDYPADPGCRNPEDNNERNSSGTGGGGGGYIPQTIPPGQVLGAETTICDWTVDTYMRRGHRNDPTQVRILQEFLNWHMNSGLTVDGIYGTRTEAAVRAFQTRYASTVLNPWSLTASTGIFYKTTLVQAKNLMCPQFLLPIPSDLINWSQNPTQVPPKI